MKPPPKRDHIHKTINFNKNIHEAPKSNRWIDMKTVLSVGMPALIAVLGWVAVDTFSADRDRKNKLRDIKLSYLIQAYTSLNNASNSAFEGRPMGIRQVDTASTLINLFGSKQEIERINIVIDQLKHTGGMDLDTLINLLRSNLRMELNIEGTDSRIRHLMLTDSSKVNGKYVKDIPESSQ